MQSFKRELPLLGKPVYIILPKFPKSIDKRGSRDVLLKQGDSPRISLYSNKKARQWKILIRQSTNSQYGSLGMSEWEKLILWMNV